MTISMRKCELRELLKMSKTTFKMYLNKRFFVELSEIGYKKESKELTPKQVNFIIEKLGVI